MELNKLERNKRIPDSHPPIHFPGTPTALSGTSDEAVPWLEQTLPHIMRQLMDSENLDMPLLQLPLAQLRLAQALYREPLPDHNKEVGAEPTLATEPLPDHREAGTEPNVGVTMGQLSDRLGVRHNALTQVADRLINHGLAERVGDPRDRRVVRLRLTETGQAWVRARRERRRAHLTALWSQLNAEERARFLQAVHTLEEIGRRLEPEAPAPQPTIVTTPLQTVEETLTRFIADVDIALTSSLAVSEAEMSLTTPNITAESSVTHAHTTSRKEDE